MNRVMLIGNLGKDPEQRTLDNGSNRVTFSIATSEKYQDKEGIWQETTEWHDIVLWRIQADNAMKYLKKGSTIFLEGKLSHRTWQDAENKTRKITEVVGTMFKVLERRSPGVDFQTPTNSAAAVNQKSSENITEEGENLPF
ncbi:MAG: single-stranded DNA-binding protein [Saprospiraceae bacterium]|jgi:single-strand DNA-binding protein